MPLLLINDLARHNGTLLPEIERAVAAVLQSGWYILGKRVAAFEAAFASYCGVAECIGVGNGTDALELALRALDIGPGDRVATVANAGGYSTAAIRAAGAEPFYVDIDAESMSMDPRLLEASLSPALRAVIVTHLYGRMADMPALLSVADAAGIPLVEDCAQAHGARLGGKTAGSWGRLGCFSFYPTKNLGALGDAGAVTTGDAALAARVRRLRQYGWSRKYCSSEAGRNSRLDELQAAVLSIKLPHLDSWNARRRSIAALYSTRLAGAGVQAPPPPGESDVAHLYVIRTPHRERIRTALEGRGIATEIHYPIPDHHQEPRPVDCRLPETEACCREVLTLPCFPEMRDDEAEAVAGAVLEALR
jgi:dTDP-4-amino-4,6-dideoxygalactose transaminase